MTARVLRTALAALAVTGILAACAPTAQPNGARPAGLDPTPQSAGTPAPVFEGTAAALPAAFDGAVIVDPGWDTPPQEADGVYLSLATEDSTVVFSAVAEDGTVLWTAQHPLVCSGFVVTAGGERPLAVLMDLTSTSDAIAAATATAYDLHTGAEVWGPVEIPGPHHGPGLVFSAPPDDFMGAEGARMALDATTGEVIADEARSDGLRVIGEHDGATILGDDGGLRAVTSAGELWRLPLAALHWTEQDAITAEGRDVGAGFALLGHDSTGFALVDLRTGALLDRDLDGAVFDQRTGTALTLGPQLRAYNRDGRRLWESAVPGGAELVSAGGALVYLRSPDGLHAYDVKTGARIQGALPDGAASVIPTQISGNGAGILRAAGPPLLVTASD